MSIDAVKAVAPYVGGASASAEAALDKRLQKVAADGKELPASPAQDVAAATKLAAQQIESYLKSVNRALEFSVDEASGRAVLSIRDATTGDLIRQIPSEEALQLARSLQAGSLSLLKTTV